MRTSIVSVVAATALFAATALAQTPAPPAPKTAVEAAEAIPELELATVAVCQGVEDRTPIGAAGTFSSDVGMLWCFTDVRNANDPTEIYHRWYINDEMINEIVINVGGPRWRCWSQKTILSSWEGECRVEIVTEAGDVIGTANFELGAVAQETAPEQRTKHSAG